VQIKLFVSLFPLLEQFCYIFRTLFYTYETLQLFFHFAHPHCVSLQLQFVRVYGSLVSANLFYSWEKANSFTTEGNGPLIIRANLFSNDYDLCHLANCLPYPFIFKLWSVVTKVFYTAFIWSFFPFVSHSYVLIWESQTQRYIILFHLM